MHCTRFWGLRQEVNWGAVPLAGLMETSLPRRSKIWQVVNVPTPDRWLGRSKINWMSGLTAGFFWSPGWRNWGHHEPSTAPLRDLFCPHRRYSRRAAPLGTGDGPSWHHLAAGGTERDRIGRWIICSTVSGLGVYVRTFRAR